MKAFLFGATLSLVLTACGSKSSKHKDPEPTATPLAPAAPIETSVPPAYIFGTEYVSYSPDSLVECLENSVLAKYCRLKGGQKTLVVAKGTEPAITQRYKIHVKCVSGSNFLDVFRLSIGDVSPISVTCTKQEEKDYVVEGKGDLVLSVANEKLLNVLNFPKKFVLEISYETVNPE